MIWSDMTASDRVSAIQRVYETGDSAGLIASKLGTTRNSIVGYYNRTPELREKCPLHLQNQAKPRQPRQSRRQNPKPRAVPPPDMPIVYSEPPKATGMRLADLGRYQCRWAVNDAKRGEEHLFCGADGFPYCPNHARLSRGPGTEGERSAVRVLRKAMA